jgi:hypothetical protein
MARKRQFRQSAVMLAEFWMVQLPALGWPDIGAPPMRFWQLSAKRWKKFAVPLRSLLTSGNGNSMP